jgi:hypothetical protein
MSRPLRICGVVVLLVVVAISAGTWDARAGQDPFHDSCEYVQAGPPGPRGNQLIVIDPNSVTVYRRGDLIVVGNYGPRCEGGRPTVHNVDRIVVHAGGEGFRYNGRFGRLGPGATPESGRSEIELSVFARRIDLQATRGDNWIVAKSRGGGRVSFDLDRGSGRAGHDFDITLFARYPGIWVEGDDGNDTIDTRGLYGTERPGRLVGHAIRVDGDHGNDTILGGAEDEEVKADAGDDLVLAGGGDDEVDIGHGRDRAYGGQGDDRVGYEGYERFTGWVADAPDRLYGGPGNDRLDDLNHHVDLIRCGPGRDHVEVGPISRDRAAPDCEQKF